MTAADTSTATAAASPPPQTTVSNPPTLTTTTSDPSRFLASLNIPSSNPPSTTTSPSLSWITPNIPPFRTVPKRTTTTTTTTTTTCLPPTAQPRPFRNPSVHPFITPPETSSTNQAPLFQPLLPLPHSYAPNSLIGSILGRAERGADQIVSVPNLPGFMRNGGGGGGGYGPTHGQRGIGLQPSPDHVVHVQQQQLGCTRIQGSPQFSGPRQVAIDGGSRGLSNGVATTPRSSIAASQTKSTFPSMLAVEKKRYQDAREKARDGSVSVVHDRRVRFKDCRVQDGPSKSLYALCRSWVHNGVPQQLQPLFGGGVKLLPRPLPLPADDSTELANTEAGEDEDTKEQMLINSLSDPSTHELLAVHVRHAKRIRTKLKTDRLQRINRYKQRLSLLLPPQLDADDNNVST